MHKNTKLLPYQRREVYRRWCQGDLVTDLAREYKVSRKTLYEVFKKAKLGVFGNYSSKNLRYRTIGQMGTVTIISLAFQHFAALPATRIGRPWR